MRGIDRTLKSFALSLLKNWICRIQFVLLSFILYFATPVLDAQNIGGVHGTVTDPGGANVAGANVLVKNLGTGLVRETTTDATGAFEVMQLLIGNYSVAVSAAGFRTTTVSNLNLHISEDLLVDVKLQLGETRQEVTVTGAPPLTDTTSSEVGNVIAGQSVHELPLNGRNVLQLALLAPGATEAEPNNGIQRFTFNSGGLTMSINGGRIDQNEYLLDGFWDQIVYFNQENISPTVDAVAEFRVRGTTSDASSGFGDGGVITYATRSGNNEFHGKMWEFVRNDMFDARNFFDATKPPYRQNQFGGILSGPIRFPMYNGKDRTFFMLSYEGLRIRQGLTGLNTIPNANEIAGNFAGLPTIYDPETTVPDPANPGGYIRTPFPGNIIPSSRIAAPSAYLASFFPLVTKGGAGNYINNAKQIEDNDQVNLRIDEKISTKDQIFGRVTFNKIGNIDPLGVSLSATPPFNPPFLPSTERAFSWNGGVHWTHLFSSSLINDAMVGVNRSRMPRDQTGPNFFGMFGIPGANTSPADYGLPSISASGFSTFGGSDIITPFNLTETDYQYADNISFVKHKHTFQLGASLLHTRLFSQFDFFAKGSVSFSGLFTADPENPATTGNSFADFLLGVPTSLTVGLGETIEHSVEYRVESYFDDAWKLTPKLTINWGLRYELLRPPVFQEPISGLDTKTGDMVVSVPGNGPLPPQVNTFIPLGVNFVTAQQAGFPSNLIPTEKTNFAPRLGVAYDLQGNGKTVIRTGAGLYYGQRQQINSTAQLRDDLPFFSMYLVNNEGVGFVPNPTSPTPTLSWNNLLSNPSALPAGTTFLGKLPLAQIWQWTVGVERQLLPNTALEVDYVGLKGSKLLESYDPNQVDLLGQVYAAKTRPFPQYGNFISWRPEATSSYNALIINLKQRFHSGLTFQAGYTWSHAIDTSSGENVGGGSGNGTRDAYAPASIDRGNSNFDSPNRFILSYVYQLPIGPNRKFLDVNGVAGKVLEGWDVGGITTYSTGVPFTATFAVDPTGLSLSTLPNVTCDPNSGAPHTPQEWFNTSCFQTQNTTYGDEGRNIIRGPGIANWDMFISKTTQIKERYSVNFRTELFNAFNKPQFLLPDASFGTSAFGTVTQASAPREIQFSLAFAF
ncbi:MAG TPA: carboxypeptidase-like regulatory domain-containing protein [Candidatus Polarisedimenticolia bacterium]|nr:carboxypeptidase-like regulatory domain-containing protein [Candidatus Polarisedimenticolia bacterium]